MTYEQLINAALGYHNLGMAEDSLAELERLDGLDRLRPEALALKVSSLMRLQRWEEAMLSGLELARQLPSEPAPYLDVAFCLHELKRTKEARTVLLNGPDALKDNATYHYNMACYETQLGNPAHARRYLDRAIEMDQRFNEVWPDDPDLKPLRRPKL